MEAYSSEAASSPQARHPTSEAATRPSSFLVMKAAAAPSPEREAGLPMVAPCENSPHLCSFPRFLLPYHSPVYAPSARCLVYLSLAAMTTTNTAKRSGKNRDISEVVCHNCKVKGHYANKCPAKKPLPGDTTTKWCSLHKTWSHSDNECMAQQATAQSCLLYTSPSPRDS